MISDRTEKMQFNFFQYYTAEVSKDLESRIGE